MDPHYGPVCIKVQNDPGRDSFGNECKNKQISCSRNFEYLCLCSEYCFYDIQKNTSSCMEEVLSNATCNDIQEKRDGECCNPYCGSCNSNENICLTCIDPHGIVENGTCICEPGYFGSVSNSSNSTCKACIDFCIECIDDVNCTSCKEPFTLNLNECICPTGYYMNNASILYQNCEQCAANCLNCSNSACYECQNYSHAIGFYCECNQGYYDAGNSTNMNCTPCLDFCTICNSSDWCFECKAKNSISINGNCTCNDGYEGDPINKHEAGCKVICDNGCLECDTFENCSMCLYQNSSSNGSSCICDKGYYGNPSSNTSCNACLSSCETCSNSINCSSCIDKNTSLIDGKCICNKRFYENPSKSGFCNECLDSCLTCNESLSCLTCIDESSEIKEGLCVCQNGFYGEPKDKNHNFGCIKCPSECDSCLNATYCYKCHDNNSEVVGGECRCIDGYFNNNTSGAQLCAECKSECKTCVNSDECLTCKSLNSYLANTGNCQCNTGFYNLSELNQENSCIQCDSLCAKCIDEYACLECNGNYTKMNSSTCICKEGYYKQSSKSSDCLKCQSNYDSAECFTNCSSNSVLINGECQNCTEFCQICESIENCLNCDESFTLDSGQCICPKGNEIISLVCTPKYFEFYLDVNSQNTISIYFTEDPEIILTEDYITIKYQGVKRSINLKLETNSTYTIQVLQIIIITDLSFTITISSPLYSIKGSQLQNYSLPGTFTYPPLSKFAQSVKTTVKTVITSSFVAAMVSNPAACWILINTIQIIIYMPIANLDFTPELLQFLKAISGYNIVPNLIDDFFDSKTTTEPIDREKRSGIDSTVFWINMGPSLLMLVVYIGFIPFLVLGTKVRYLRDRCKKYIENYKFSFFIRFWIQSFMDFGIFALIQVNSVIFI